MIKFFNYTKVPGDLRGISANTCRVWFFKLFLASQTHKSRMKTDAFDKHLLRLLQQNNQLTSDELAAEVGLSASAVQRRLKKLRSEKVIQADISVISPAAAGIDITCVVDVSLERGTSQALEKFKASMLKCKEVSQCYYVTGSYDFILIVNTQTMQQYEAFTNKWLLDSPNVKHFYTHVVMDKVKVGLGVAI
jgi:Lrp/AsnC family transcriptional regulator, leucine-responsive regulatory protein